MSLIPKISIGRYGKKNKFHIPSLTHGTSEIGYVCPSYSRNLINDATLNIGTRTAVRLSPLFVPTMGDLSVRLYHNFIPFNKIWTPFDAFLDKKPFTFPLGNTEVPQSIPYFYVGSLIRNLMRFYNFGNFYSYDDIPFDTLASDLTATIYFKTRGGLNNWWHPVNTRAINTDTDYSDVEELTAAIPKLFGSVHPFAISGRGGAPSFIVFPNDDHYSDDDYDTFGRLYYDDNGVQMWRLSQSNAQHEGDIPTIPGQNLTSVYDRLSQLSQPSYDACDFSVRIDNVDGFDFTICYNFNGAWKRLRSIFLGLGYSFNPYDMDFKVTPLKLLAFYRAYWSHFGVNRDVNFQDTFCCKMSRYLNTIHSEQMSYDNSTSFFMHFCGKELINCTYTTPSDYFSSAVQDTQQGVSNMYDDNGIIRITSPQTGAVTPGVLGVGQGSDVVVAGVGEEFPVTSPNQSNIGNNALGIQMALKLLRWVNRYTSVGSQIYDGLQARYGRIDVNDESSEGVIKLGDSSTSVDIGAIFNQSETSEGQLGSFAGVGTGSSKSDTIHFTAPSFGVFITLTAVVPQMGYFQGAFKENSDGTGDSWEMFDNTFDAVGWQPVKYAELVADRQFVFNGDEQVGTNLPTFGYQPRYTHMKVGFNRCIGDISLPHMQDSMLPYTLDRFFPQRENTLPSTSPQWFRSGTRGETNRIFNVTTPTDDHVIWQIYFDVDMDAPMKSISDSYDTHLPEDSTSIEVSHE